MKLIRECPICGDEIKYRSLGLLEYAEKMGLCCGKCGLGHYERGFRKETDFDNKLREGFEMLCQEDTNEIDMVGCDYIEVDDSTRRLLEKYNDLFNK